MKTLKLKAEQLKINKVTHIIKIVVESHYNYCKKGNIQQKLPKKIMKTVMAL